MGSLRAPQVKFILGPGQRIHHGGTETRRFLFLPFW